jgi:hypothetical protein
MAYVLGRQLRSLVPTAADFYHVLGLVKKNKMYRLSKPCLSHYEVHADKGFWTDGHFTGHPTLTIFDAADEETYRQLYFCGPELVIPRSLDLSLPLSTRGVFRTSFDEAFLRQLVSTAERDGYLFVVRLASPEEPADFHLLRAIYKIRRQRLLTTALVIKRLGVCKDLLNRIALTMMGE